MTLPTPDRASLALLPTATPTLPTPPLSATLPPRPTDTITPTPTPTATATPTATSTSTPTATPTATSTATPGPAVRAAGFSDPLLTKLDGLGYEVAEQQTTGPSGHRIVALILQPPKVGEGEPIGDKLPRLLIYAKRSGKPPELIWQDEGNDESLQFAGLGYSWDQPLGWKDINGDGLLELPVSAANGGYCWACNRIYVLQLVPPGRATTAGGPAAVEHATDDPSGRAAGTSQATTVPEIRELTGAVPFLNLLTNPMVPKWLTGGSDKAGLQVLDGRFEFGFGLDRLYSPGIYRPYSWSGSGYEDISRWNPGYFDTQIQKAQEAVQSTYGQPLQGQPEIGKSLVVLLAYEASGRRDEGWTTFWQLSDPANWAGEATPGATNWLVRVREHLKGQYDRGEPFAPWPPEVPTPPVPSQSGEQATPTPEGSVPGAPAAAPEATLPASTPAPSPEATQTTTEPTMPAVEPSPTPAA